MAEVRDTTKLENKEELKIAWRYENLSLDDSKEKTGNAFDLSLPYVIPDSQKTNMAVWYGDKKPKVQETKGETFCKLDFIFQILLTIFTFRNHSKLQLFKSS